MPMGLVIYKCKLTIGIEVRVFGNGLGEQGSIPGQSYQRLERLA